MTIRITQSMMYARSLYNIRRASRGIVETQEQVASGRRINRPSDDPAAMLRLLPLNAGIQNLTNLGESAANARETLNTGSKALEEASSALSRLKELLVQASNGTVSAGDRQSIGVEVDQLLQHMVGIGNSKRAGSYLFSGTRTDTPPFRVVSNPGGTRVVYDGSQEAHEIEVAPGTKTTLFSSGEQIFLGTDRQGTTITGTTGAAATNFADTGRGFATLDVTFNSLLGSSLPTGITAGSGIADSTAVGQLDYVFDAGANTLSVGGGPAVPIPATNGEFTTSTGARIFLDVANPVTPATGTFTAQADLSIDGGASTTLVDFTDSDVRVTNLHDGGLLNVNVAALNRTGADKVTFTGTFDVFTVMIEARDALLNKSDALQPDVQEKLTQLIGEVTTAHDTVLTGLQELGIRSSNIELLTSRIDGLILSDQSTRSSIQDTDLAEAISDMNQKQFGFQASLTVSARIVQTSLLDFLR